jgi:hypothetical protein
VYFEKLLHASMLLKISQGLKNRVPKIMFLLIESWIFIFKYIFIACDITLCHFQCNCSYLNLKSLIFFKFQSVGVLSQNPPNKKNSSSLILKSLRVEFEPHVLNPI